MLNLYSSLGIKPTATTVEIQAAMRKAAETQSMPLEHLQKCKEWLLNEEIRKKYNAKLYTEHPEIIHEMMAEQAAVEKNFAQDTKSPPAKTETNLNTGKTKQKFDHKVIGDVSPYIQATLNNGENVVYQASVSWWSQIWYLFFGINSLFAGFYGINMMFFLGVCFLIIAYVNVTTTELALTDRRVIAKFGFIRREAVEIPLSRVESIQVRQGIIGRMFDYGSVVVRGTGGGNAPVPYISNPLQFRRTVAELLDNSQDRAH